MQQLQDTSSKLDISYLYHKYSQQPLATADLSDAIEPVMNFILSCKAPRVPCKLHDMLLSLEAISTVEEAQQYISCIKSVLDRATYVEEKQRYTYFLLSYMLVYVYTFMYKEKVSWVNKLYAYCLLSFDYSKISEIPI